jgi:hypothetical protein
VSLHDSASTAQLSVTHGDAATIAKVLRKTDALPLTKLCAQIRQENYRDWVRWERNLDFSETMAGRYGLACPDQDSFSFAQKDAMLPEHAPVAAYWQMRLRAPEQAAHVPVSAVEDLPLFAATLEQIALARVCAQDMRRELMNLLERCDLPGIASEHLIASYEHLAQDITQAEAWLGVSLDCEALQLTLEQTLMALV